jgi:hypothetical protein
MLASPFTQSPLLAWAHLWLPPLVAPPADSPSMPTAVVAPAVDLAPHGAPMAPAVPGYTQPPASYAPPAYPTSAYPVYGASAPTTYGAPAAYGAPSPPAYLSAAAPQAYAPTHAPPQLPYGVPPVSVQPSPGGVPYTHDVNLQGGFAPFSYRPYGPAPGSLHLLDHILLLGRTRPPRLAAPCLGRTSLRYLQGCNAC